jgi:hypothetical protein
MSGNGAFGEEMSTDVKAFMDSARVALTEPLDPRLESDLVRLVAAEARTASAAAPTREIPARRRGRFALPARIAVAAGSLVLATAGLAVAGVNLPNPVSSAFEKAGVNLPNQSGEDSGAAPDSNAPAAPQPGAAPGAKGESHGAGKAKGRHRGKRHHKPGAAAHGHDNKGNHGASPNGKSESAPGQTKPKLKIKPSHAQGRSRVHPPKPPKPVPPAARGKGVSL